MLDVKDSWVLGEGDRLPFISLVKIKLKRWCYILRYFGHQIGGGSLFLHRYNISIFC